MHDSSEDLNRDPVDEKVQKKKKRQYFQGWSLNNGEINLAISLKGKDVNVLDKKSRYFLKMWKYLWVRTVKWWPNLDNYPEHRLECIVSNHSIFYYYCIDCGITKELNILG